MSNQMFLCQTSFLIFSLVYHPQNFILIGFKHKGKIFFNLTHFHSLLQKSRKTFLFFSQTDFHFLTILNFSFLVKMEQAGLPETNIEVAH